METTTYLMRIGNGDCPAGTRDSIGGTPIFQEGQSTPECERCESPMALFLQFDIRAEFGTPFKPGSHLMIFSCPKCEDEIPVDEYSDHSKTVGERYGQRGDFYSLILNRPGGTEVIGPSDPQLKARPLSFEAATEEIEVNEYVGLSSSNYGRKVGGCPAWMNYAVDLNCPCGGKIEFLCQIEDGCSDFLKPDRGYVHLFNGNQIYVMACNRQCSPHALLVVLDN